MNKYISPISRRHSQPSDDLPLRDTHPQLFKAMVLKGFTLGLIALAIITVPEAIIDSQFHSDTIIPNWFWAGVYMTIALVLLYGISSGTERYKWARRSLVAGAIISGIWAVAYVFALFGTGVARPFGTIFWIYMNINFIIWAGEPAFNPLSSALSEKHLEVDPEYDAR